MGLKQSGLAAAPLAALLLTAPGSALAGNQEHILRLMETKTCPSCRLQDADLVYADLRDAQLAKAQLQRANLSRAQLDGADLRGTNLSFTSLTGASLRGADLRGAQLEGADLREADLSGAKLDNEALARSHWRGATGVSAEVSSYPAMHNAGVEASQQGRFPEAEEYFNKALLKHPMRPSPGWHGASREPSKPNGNWLRRTSPTQPRCMNNRARRKRQNSYARAQPNWPKIPRNQAMAPAAPSCRVRSTSFSS